MQWYYLYSQARVCTSSNRHFPNQPVHLQPTHRSRSSRIQFAEPLVIKQFLCKSPWNTTRVQTTPTHRTRCRPWRCSGWSRSRHCWRCSSCHGGGDGNEWSAWKKLNIVTLFPVVLSVGGRQHIWALVLTETDQDCMGGLLLLFKKFILLKGVCLFLSNFKLYGSMI